MNRKQKIIVSVTGIFLVLLILMGLTYAYFLTQINGNTKEKSISATSANLELKYEDGTNIILGADVKLEPSNEAIGTKTFTVTNNGDSVIENYNVYLEHVVNELTRTQDLVYTLKCEVYQGENKKGECENQTSTETKFPTLFGTILKNTINPGDTHSYALTLYYKEAGVDQGIDMDKFVNARVNIYDDNDIPNRLNELVMNDSNIPKNTGTPNFTNNEMDFAGMYKAPDDYGDSWYFRGAQNYNYVNFAGQTWRIIRINGDDSIRLILNNVYADTLSFNSSPGDNAYVGYMYGSFTAPSKSYDEAHRNEVSSTIKQKVDEFYTTYIENDANNYHYGKYLADTMFCGDKTLANHGVGGIATQTGYTYDSSKGSRNYSTYYAAAERMYFSTDSNGNNVVKPTLECAANNNSSNDFMTEEQRAYSRYTSGIDSTERTIKNVLVNNDLTYPIGLISADEIVMAGIKPASSNYGTYLSPISGNYEGSMWSMTPRMYDSTGPAARGFTFTLPNESTNDRVHYTSGLRPVINLKSTVTVTKGSGTAGDPYVIKTS